MSPIKNSPAMMTVICKVLNYQETAGYCPPEKHQTDVNLAIVTARLGGIVNTVNPRERQQSLLRLASWVWNWLESLNLSRSDIARRIADERDRQRELFAARKLKFRVDDPAVDWPRKLRVLVEEVGEVAQAIDQWEASPRCKKFRAHFITELIQVAAVCVAWLESMEVSS
jgi:hypothetical protein